MPGKQKQKKTGYTGYAARFVPKKARRTPEEEHYLYQELNYVPPARTTSEKLRRLYRKARTKIPPAGRKTITRRGTNQPKNIPVRAKIVLRRLTKRRGGSGGARKR